MKKYLLLIPIALVFLFSSYAFSSPATEKLDINGTMNDDEWSNLGGGYVSKENDAYGGDVYDVEKLALFIDNGVLYFGLQTDFNLESGIGNIEAGDFIFDFNGNDGKYDLALSFYFENGSVSLNAYYGDGLSWNKTTDYKNWGNDSNKRVYLGPLNKSSYYNWNNSYDGAPWQVANNTSGESITADVAYGNSSGTNYTIEAAINLNNLSNELANLFVGTDKNVTMLWQMECGNDYLEVKETYDYTRNTPVSPVPEPATFLLFGIGLLSLSSVGRYKLNK